MKKLRRIAALSLALILGSVAWMGVMLTTPSEEELRLSRELSTGRLVARVPSPKSFFKFIIFGPPTIAARYRQPATGASGALPQGVVFDSVDVGKPTRDSMVWYVQLDPTDKSWEIDVSESRPIFLTLGKKRWRVGTKTRVWKTNRSAGGPE